MRKGHIIDKKKAKHVWKKVKKSFWGVPPSLNGKNPLSSFWQLPLIPLLTNLGWTFLDPFWAPLRNQIAKSWVQICPWWCWNIPASFKSFPSQGKKIPITGTQVHYLRARNSRRVVFFIPAPIKLLNEFIGHFIWTLWKILWVSSSLMEVGVMNHTIQFHYNRCFS